MTTRLPKLVAFDLDYTLWDLWIDTHAMGPLTREGETLNQVLDKYGEVISFYPDVGQILHRFRNAEVTIAACSRTSATVLAREALSHLLIPPKAGDKESPPERAIDFFDQLEIYPGSKIPHFRQLHKKTGLPFSEMLFFDDEPRNREVEKLGVTFCLVKRGVNMKVVDEGLAEWRRRHPLEVEEDAAGK